MTRLWAVSKDRACRVVPGPGRWHRCATCKTRYRMIGRYVRPTTQPCPGCAVRRVPYSVGALRIVAGHDTASATMSEAAPGWDQTRPLTTPRAKEARRHG